MKSAVFTIVFFSIWVKISSQDTLTWDYYHPIKNEWKSFGNIGSIQQKLIEAGELPAPFKEENDEKFRWVEDYSWRLKTEINANLSEGNRDATLIFENIDTYGEVFLNGEVLYAADNYFIPHKICLKNLLKNGVNTIEIILTPPKLYHKEKFKKEEFHYPAPNDVDSIFISSRTRKPQFHFGWDWTARMNTIGMDKPVIFYTNGTPLIQDISVLTQEIKQNVASLTAQIKLDSSFIGLIRSKYVPSTVVMQAKNKIDVSIQIEQPRLWEPVGLGASHLYLDTLLLLNSKGEIIEKRAFYFGIRSVVLSQDKDSIGTTFSLSINEKEIFCLGMNIIPPKVFLSELNKNIYDTLLSQIKDSKANMVRIWGGGTYFDDYFYEQCSQNGIMVWHDFMFACAMYPGESEFTTNIEKEIDFQSFRLSKHPCVVLFNGNNEIDVAWKYWGFQKQYNLSESAQKIIENSYKQLFHIRIPDIVAKNSTVPYTHTSPLSNWGLPDRFNHGTQHYWGVWHGNDSLSDFSKNIGRFNAEYGFQSFPSLKTMTYFTAHENWDLENPMLAHHQKSYVGNRKIEQHRSNYFTKPKNFEEFIYQSQLIQKIAMETAIKAHRLDAPRCMGSLFWQFNDCYPGPTWSSIDYSNQRKALYYVLPYLFHPKTAFITNNDIVAVSSYLDKNPQDEHYFLLRFYNKRGQKMDEQKCCFSSDRWTERVETRIPQKTHFIEVALGELCYLEFLHPKKVIRSNGRIKIKKITFEKQSGLGTLTFKVKRPVQDIFFFDLKGNINFSKNYSSFLPGCYSLNFTADMTPNKIAFFYH